MCQPLSIAYTHGMFRVESIERRLQVYRQIYESSSIRNTVMRSGRLVIYIVLHLLLIMYGPGTSYHHCLFINIPVSYVNSLAHTKALTDCLRELGLG